MALPCLKKGLTAQKLAKLYLERCVALMGLPNEVLSDNDHLITSFFFRTLFEMSGVEQHSSVVYRPRGNGRAETAVKSVIEMLRRALVEQDKPWIDVLPWVMYQLNDLPGVDDKHSPHKIVFGRDPVGLGDIPANTPNGD